MDFHSVIVWLFLRFARFRGWLCAKLSGQKGVAVEEVSLSDFEISSPEQQSSYVLCGDYCRGVIIMFCVVIIVGV